MSPTNKVTLRIRAKYVSQNILICMAISMFIFALGGLYEHALTRHSDPFNQEN